MTLETHGSEIPLSPLKGIDVKKIEKELASMWSGVSEGKDSGSSACVTRACALNLIVYTTPSDDRGRLENLLDQVNEQHPGRNLILVAHRDTATPRLEGYVSMRSRPLGGAGKQICGEEVCIEAGGPLVETAATAVAPLLVPDVPVFLWWKDIPHYEDKLFDRLAQMADRIVIDSAAFDHPYDDLLRLSSMIADGSRRMRVSDLNWGRLTSWRTLLASFWDVFDYRPQLDKIDLVEIKYRSPNDAPGEIAPRALLMAGWLSSRLNWEVVGKSVSPDGVVKCELRVADRSIGIVFEQDRTAGLNDGMVSSVVLSGGAAKFSVAKRTDGTKLETEAQIGDERSAGRVLAYENRTEADQLNRELAFLSRDTIYEAAVNRAAELVASIRNQIPAP